MRVSSLSIATLAGATLWSACSVPNRRYDPCVFDACADAGSAERAGTAGASGGQENGGGAGDAGASHAGAGDAGSGDRSTGGSATADAGSAGTALSSMGGASSTSAGEGGAGSTVQGGSDLVTVGAGSGTAGYAGSKGLPAGGGGNDGQAGAPTAPIGGSGGEGGAAGNEGGAAGNEGGSGEPATENGFEGGPCVARDPAKREEVFIYARGTNQRLYRAVATQGAAGTWTELPGVDGSLLAPGTDIDCSTAFNSTASDPMTYIVGLGSMPYGRLRVASGSGTVFSDFAELSVSSSSGQSFTTTPSVTAWYTDGIYDIMIANPGALPGITGLLLIQDDDYPTASWPNAETTPLPPTLVSGVDTIRQGTTSGRIWYTAGIVDDGRLQLALRTEGAVNGWPEAVYFLPPSGLSLDHSPAICLPEYYGEQAYREYLLVVAGGRLWYSVKKVQGGGSAGFSAWRELADVEVASAPDCYFSGNSAEGVMHAAALTRSGTIMHLQGNDAEGFVATELRERPE